MLMFTLGISCLTTSNLPWFTDLTFLCNIALYSIGPCFHHQSHPQPCLMQWNYEPCHVGPPKTDGSWWRVLTKCGPLEKGMANRFSIPAFRSPRSVWKGKKIGHWKMNSPGQQVPSMLLEISGEITPKEWRDRDKAKTTPSCGCDVMEVKSDAVKSNIA